MSEGGAFGTGLGHDSEALMNGIRVLIKETPQSFLIPSTMWGPREKTAVYEQGNRSSPELNLLAPGSGVSQPPALWQIKFCCFSGLWYFVTAAWMDWDILPMPYVSYIAFTITINEYV